MRAWIVGLAAFAVSCGSAIAGEITNVRIWSAPDHTRLVFDTDAPVDHSVFVLANPDRVVVDLRRTRLSAPIERPSRFDKLLDRIRSAPRGSGDLRVVLDMKAAARPKSFNLAPNNKYGHRLVIDLQSAAGGETAVAAATPAARKQEPASSGRPRDVMVVIDPGHGGEDPGAIGRKRTFEKDIVLKVSKRLKQVIDRQPGMRAALTRNGDYYVGLRRRMQIARAHGADLFVSVHADGFKDPRVRGSSVYILSRNGASSEAAKWLAQRENSADLVGGVSLDDKDDLLASVLLDLSQTATLSASADVASKVVRRLRGVGKMHKRHVERAGFVVLKSPDIPSLLVETAFISNPDDERRLRKASYQHELAKAIFAGVRAYFDRNPPPGTLLAKRRHVITRGDTLSTIASRYGVSIASLRAANSIDGNVIRVGQVLHIPSAIDG